MCSRRHGSTGGHRPTTRDMPLFSCGDAGSMHLCIFSLCEKCGCILSFWVLVQVDLGSLAACSRLGSVGVGEGTGNQEKRGEDCKTVQELQLHFPGPYSTLQWPSRIVGKCLCTIRPAMFARTSIPSSSRAALLTSHRAALQRPARAFRMTTTAQVIQLACAFAELV